ncbi:MAG: carbamoyltransferase HypF [Vitreoscilla sp.]|nr:carbamoyltransferase HypF [Vitreoscilla sp.]
MAIPDSLLPRAAPARVLALGAWLKNSACRVDGNRLAGSGLHGDLDDPAACLALEATARHLVALGPLDALAHDLHPDFHSTRLAQELAHRLGIPAIGVQHHHAHVAVVQAEQGLAEPVIGLALDGVGLGTDGQAWGGELLWVDGAQCQRLGHLPPLALPGGDAAAREPWRMAAAVLHAAGRGAEIGPRFASRVGGTAASTVQTLLQRGLRCPPSTSAGRWFDAAAAALGLCLRQHTEAEAAMALERAAQQGLAEHPGIAREAAGLVPLTADPRSGAVVPDLHALLARLFALADAEGPAAAPRGAALFHAALADALARAVVQAARGRFTFTVVLGGGCFFNRVLTSRLREPLQQAGLRVLQPQALSCGDAGLALGQAWVAAHQVALARPSSSAELSSCA